MAILVTGGCGLVGAFAVRWAAAHGERVIAFDIAPKTHLFEGIRDQVDIVQGDVLNAPDLMGAISTHKVDRILHAASFLTPAAYARPYAAVELTVMGGLNVLEAARIHRIERTVIVSTGKAPLTGAQYADSRSGRIPVPADPYTSAKVAAELLVNDYRRLYDMDVVIVRLAQVFGPGFDFSGAMGQRFKSLVERSLQGEGVTMELSELSFTGAPPEVEPEPVIRPLGLLYAADAGRGAMMATLAGSLSDAVFNIQPKEQLNIADVAALINRLIPGADVKAPHTAGESGPIEPDPRARDQFGYIPEYGAERGFREYIEFLKTGSYRPLEA